ncbi:MAG: amidohydrolase [Deltaproteobacteria bacterium]|nr:amidohydrolase [Deltaproteobacteria bacterium]MBW1949330.1 amidohydrolase [Deltaproteobacteria bacterium]MBW2348135.1 amidohydrolase [Deltaproteobacteria bacterium]
MLNPPLESLNDPEGDAVPEGLPPVMDAHVHVFPAPIFRSIWKWFDRYGWSVRYRLDADAVVSFLTSRGVDRVVALQYAHRPGIARELNRFMAALCRRHGGRVLGLGTVFPGEPGFEDIIREIRDLGLRGVKLHAHVQCFDVDGPEMEAIYALCSGLDLPVFLHGGKEPKSPAYACDPHLLCGARKVENILRNFPTLRLLVPHFGMDEIATFARLLEKYDNIWVDTAMTLAGYFPGQSPPNLATVRPERVMYGSDFPNLPYAWDRELKAIHGLNLPEDRLRMLLHRNARELFSTDRPAKGGHDADL